MFVRAVIPTIVLELGSNLNPEDIEEGDDVYFECKVHANPAAYKVIWKHNVSFFIFWKPHKTFNIINLFVLNFLKLFIPN